MFSSVVQIRRRHFSQKISCPLITYLFCPDRNGMCTKWSLNILIALRTKCDFFKWVTTFAVSNGLNYHFPIKPYLSNLKWSRFFWIWLYVFIFCKHQAYLCNLTTHFFSLFLSQASPRSPLSLVWYHCPMALFYRAELQATQSLWPPTSALFQQSITLPVFLLYQYSFHGWGELCVIYLGQWCSFQQHP